MIVFRALAAPLFYISRRAVGGSAFFFGAGQTAFCSFFFDCASCFFDLYGIIIVIPIKTRIQSLGRRRKKGGIGLYFGGKFAYPTKKHALAA